MQGVEEWIIGFPILSFEFKETYPYDHLPKWQRDFIRKNRKLYFKYKEFIDLWLMKYVNLENFKPTYRKSEWQCGTSCSSIWESVIQFRPSRIRAKRPDTFPALVAMVHIPIIGKFKRRFTLRKVANLQSFPSDFIINRN